MVRPPLPTVIATAPDQLIQTNRLDHRHRSSTSVIRGCSTVAGARNGGGDAVRSRAIPYTTAVNTSRDAPPRSRNSMAIELAASASRITDNRPPVGARRRPKRSREIRIRAPRCRWRSERPACRNADLEYRLPGSAVSRYPILDDDSRRLSGCNDRRRLDGHMARPRSDRPEHLSQRHSKTTTIRVRPARLSVHHQAAPAWAAIMPRTGGRTRREIRTTLPRGESSPVFQSPGRTAEVHVVASSLASQPSSSMPEKVPSRLYRPGIPPARGSRWPFPTSRRCAGPSALDLHLDTQGAAHLGRGALRHRGLEADQRIGRRGAGGQRGGSGRGTRGGFSWSPPCIPAAYISAAGWLSSRRCRCGLHLSSPCDVAVRVGGVCPQSPPAVRGGSHLTFCLPLYIAPRLGRCVNRSFAIWQPPRGLACLRHLIARENDIAAKAQPFSLQKSRSCRRILPRCAGAAREIRTVSGRSPAGTRG